MEEFNTLEFPITQNFSPIIPVEVLGPGQAINIVGILDTGFTGFLQMPLVSGIQCKLNLWSIQPSILADGRKVNNLMCFGTIRFGGKEHPGLIALSETGNDCLLGMQFLQALNCDFTVSIPQQRAIFKIPNPLPPTSN